jgi:hypothetical protein
VSEIEELAAGLREYYEPEGILGEILVQKIIVENARYGRVLTLEQLEQLEQPEPVYNLARVVHCLDRTSRYSTATSRALYKAIEELERHEAARKLAKSLPLQWMRNRPSDLPHSTRAS